ncbi:YwdI family protein [Oceanobacillus sp. CAU 1775]
MKDITIINKMIKELNLAKEKTNAREELLTHISHVKLLCELFLEDDTSNEATTKSSASEITEQEIKAMLGEQKQDPSKKEERSTVDFDDANGDSIFDF